MQHLVMNRSERIQRWLLRVLRHSQVTDGLSLDRAGWADVPDVLAVLPVTVSGWTPVSQDELLGLIATCLSDRVEWHGQRIRALYGHSSPSVDVCRIAIPPTALFHATSRLLLPEIFAEGLLPGLRTRVHLTSEVGYAQGLAAHLGRGVILQIDTDAVQSAGHRFYATSTHVWQVETVPPIALSIFEMAGSDYDD